MSTVALTVVKCGGAFLAQGRFDLAVHAGRGEDVCVVHGAGHRITRALDAAGIRSEFVGGRRVTPERALPAVRAAFQAENDLLCAQIGPRAVGLMGDELGLEAEPIPGLGHAGALLPVVPAALADAIAAGRVPVVAPLARGPLNVNADDAAATLAVALDAERLVFVSDVPGVIVDGDVVPQLSEEEIATFGHQLGGGMLPKLQAALVAARGGVAVSVGCTAVVTAV